MKAIVQRVASASVTVNNEIISEIGKGICVLVGLSRDDSVADVDYLVRKLINMRIFEGDDGKKWNLSVKDKGYEVLCCSQFTLYALMKGNKPDFHQSMAPDKSRELYQLFVDKMKQNYKPDLVKEGRFQTFCHVNIVNDGPVTICLESPKAKSSTDEIKDNDS
ncbi:D-aminoacyl-tRNA deacylase-like [Panonychus citri]|uniref:D-aminoacyl-tRNA deacylase-like n=1 Tax=Panonychus citri TaxID=50023 RepID=UPI002306F22B|nr:D-aminoacyl-tRNA deacylase-like [Panonychus citri]